MDKYIVSKNVVYSVHNDGMFQGYSRVMPVVPEREPYLSFVGPKIQLVTWRQILAFFKWADDTTHSEVQVRLYFNKEKSEWKAWAFPQEKDTGMTTREIPDLCDKECSRVGLFSKKGWIEGGTAHSHCKMGAFQSPTDKSNESTKNGVHFTIGKLGDANYDIDSRVSFKGEFYSVILGQWFDLPAGLESLPFKFHNDVLRHIITSAVTDKDTFPDEWKANVIVVEKKIITPTHRPGPGSLWPEHVTTGNGSGVAQGGRGTGSASTPASATRTTATIGNKGIDSLSKKERNKLRHLLEKVGHDEALGWSEEDTQKLHRASIAVIQLSASMGMEADDVLRAGLRRPDMLDTLEKTAVDLLEGILQKEGVALGDVEEWIHMTSAVEV